MKRMVRIVLLAGLATAAVPATAYPQGFTVTGRVTDGQLGSRVNGVSVAVNRIVRTMTDATGGFVLVNMDYGTSIIELRRIGYESLAFDVWVDSTLGTLAVTMAPLSVRLRDLVVVTARPTLNPMFGFDMRRQEGNGHFLTRDDIENRTPVRFSDVLRGVPGLRITPDPHYFGNTVEAIRSTGFQSCQPVLYLDGMMMDQTVRLDNVVSWRQVDGVEVYIGPAQIPARFNATNSVCAVIVVWTH